MGKRWADDIGWVLAILLIAAAIALLVVPVLMTLVASFDARNFMGPFPPKQLSLRWYAKLFDNHRYLIGLTTTLMVTFPAALIATAIGVTTAVALHRGRFRGREAIAGLFLSPVIVPGVVIGFSLLLFLAKLGIGDGLTRLLLGHVLISIPYTVRTTLSGLVGIRPSLNEAALVLGANEWQSFRTVTFPLAKTGIISGFLIAVAFSLDDVAVSAFLGDSTHYTFSISLLSDMRANFDLTTAAASVLLIGFTVALVFVIDRLVGIEKVFGASVHR
jgi:putative spermidine/putrescine transport system permease protein